MTVVRSSATQKSFRSKVAWRSSEVSQRKSKVITRTTTTTRRSNSGHLLTASAGRQKYAESKIMAKFQVWASLVNNWPSRYAGLWWILWRKGYRMPSQLMVDKSEPSLKFSHDCTLLIHIILYKVTFYINKRNLKRVTWFIIMCPALSSCSSTISICILYWRISNNNTSTNPLRARCC